MFRVIEPVLAVAAWTISRALMAWQFYQQEQHISFDLRYYYWQLTNAGLDDGLVEYPPPVAVLLEVMRQIFGGSEPTYVWAVALLMAALDAAAAVWLWRSHSRRSAIYWATFTFLVGPLIWFRIDLLPAVAVLAALVWVTRRPVAAGAAVAVGAATKLWPALLIVPMIGLTRTAMRRMIGFLAAGGTLGLASLIFFGWDRSTSALTWQSDRGLQIESIAATIPMLRHAFGPAGRYHTELSVHNAWEIYGPQVEFWQATTDVALVIAVLLTLLLGWMIAFNGAGLPGRRLSSAAQEASSLLRTRAIVLAQLAIICTVIVANKTFSPQYVIWLAGPLAVLINVPAPKQERSVSRTLAVLGLATALLTHLVFPLNYYGLISELPAAGATVLLVGRNLVMLAFTAVSIVCAIRSALLAGRPGASRPLNS